jgi:hypothetical protein
MTEQANKQTRFILAVKNAILLKIWQKQKTDVENSVLLHIITIVLLLLDVSTIIHET